MSSPVMRPVSCCIAVIVAAFLTTPAFAQSTGGRVIGKVSDPTGAVVAGVKVTLTNQSTGVARDTITNDSGDYAFIEVAPGGYRAEYSLQGFKKFVQSDIKLDINQVITLNATLQPGGAQEVVEVTSSAPLVDTTSTQLGAVVDDRSVAGLPLNARDTYQLLQIQPGVQGTGGADLFYGSNQSGAVSVNGGRGRANNFSVNGGDANDLFVNSPAVQPSPDTIAEFRVITNNFDAEYGRNSGAVVNVVTKSGTNFLHGDVYEFLRNKSLNGKGFLDPVKPDNHTNQFGGTLGGPIKKDHAFFFVSYEGRRSLTGITSDPVVVPDQSQRNGDFSASPFDPTAVITDQTVADIINGRCGSSLTAGPASAGEAWASVFPNSQIPATCFDPVAASLLQQFVPFPNSPNDIFGSIPNVHQTVANGTENDDQFTTRIDHRLGNKQNLSLYYYLLDSRQAQPFTRFEALTPNLLEGFGNSDATRSQQINLSHAWTISNTVVNESRFTFFRNSQGTFLHPQRHDLVTNSCTGNAANFCFNGNFDVPNIFTPDPKLGITPGLGPNHEGVPFISLSSGFTIGNDYEGELPQTGNTFQWSDSLSKVKGAHTMKFGADVRRAYFNQTLYFDPNGDYSFFGGGPNDLIATNNSDGSQNFVPNFLMGLPDSFLQGSTNSEAIRSTSLYLFAQDSWKIKSNITMNYGLRWELNTPLMDSGRKVQTFRPGEASAIFPCQLSAASVSTFQSLGVANPDCTNTGVTPVGLVVPGDKGVPSGLTNTYYHSFAPRIGLAYSPGSSGKTSIRTGFGIFYNPMEQLVLEQFQAEPPFGVSTTVSEGFLDTPFALQSCEDSGTPCTVGGVGVVPNAAGTILNPPRGQAVDWSVFRPMILFGELQPNIRPQYEEQYNLTVQRELTQDIVLQVGYVGTQGHRLLATRDINYGNSQTCLDLIALSNTYNDPNLACGQFLEDSAYFIPTLEGSTPVVAPAGGLHIPYGPNGPAVIPAGTPISSVVTNGATGLTLVGLRRFSSPLCDPYSGTNCPADGTPVFASIFAQNTVANSNYNSLQVSLEKRASHGLQFLAAYTFSKTIDDASTFEEIQNPLNSRANRSLSLLGAKQRFVFSYVWDPPIPKYAGGKGLVLNGWQLSGITSFQSGFPIRILSNNDDELMNSFDFNLPGKPDLIAPFHTLNPKTNGGNYFDTSAFADPVIDPATSTPLQLLGSAPRAICCGPGINNWDIALHKITPIGEKLSSEFRLELFNAFNHVQFQNPDGNFSDGAYFGRVLHTRDPRQIQLALKLLF